MPALAHVQLKEPAETPSTLPMPSTTKRSSMVPPAAALHQQVVPTLAHVQLKEPADGALGRVHVPPQRRLR